jgi:hypothetical protein
MARAYWICFKCPTNALSLQAFGASADHRFFSRDQVVAGFVRGHVYW